MLGILPASDIKNKPVLIHGGSSAVGLASINVALELGAIVLTTVESSEKALIISKQFLQVPTFNYYVLLKTCSVNSRFLIYNHFNLSLLFDSSSRGTERFITD